MLQQMTERERERERTTSRTFKKSPKRICCNIMVVVLDLKRVAHPKLNAWKKLGFTGFPFEQVGLIWNVEDFRVPGPREALRRPAWISSRPRTRMMMPPHQSKLQMWTAKVRCFVWLKFQIHINLSNIFLYRHVYITKHILTFGHMNIYHEMDFQPNAETLRLHT